jgi:phage terminase small subunit
MATKKKAVKKKILTKTTTVPERAEKVLDCDYDELAKEYGLTEMQAKFAYFYVFVTGLNGPEAVKLAGYSQGNYTEDKYPDERMREFYIGALLRSQAKTLCDNPKILTLITKLREELSNQLIVDKLYVLQNLKRLAETATETVQLRALEKLGETMEMFGQKQIIEEREDPAKIAAAKFEKRKQMSAEGNVVPFTKEGS